MLERLLMRLSGAVSAALRPLRTDTPDDPPDVEAVDRLMRAEVGRSAPGLAVAVLRHGRVLHLAGYGAADPDTGRRVDPDTRFDAGALTPTLLALAAAHQIEDGTLAPRTAVDDLLPVFRAAAPPGMRPVTVSDLVHRTSGLAEEPAGRDDHAVLGGVRRGERLAALARRPRAAPPGLAADRHDTASGVLAAAIAAAEDARSAALVLRQRLFARAGMRASEPGTAGLLHDGVVGHRRLGGRTIALPGPAAPGGGLVTTLADLARLEIALARGRLLPAEAVERLFEVGRLDDGRPVADDEGRGRAWGFAMVRYGGQDCATAGGGALGQTVHWQRNLSTGIAVILVANVEGLDAAGLAADVELALEAHPELW